MSNLQQKLALYGKAAQKGADWLVARQRKDGAIDPQHGMSSVYKTSLALVLAGRLDSAWRLMDYIAANYLTEPGEFHAEADAKGELDQSFGFYRNCYILLAGLRLGRFDIASPAALAHFYRHQHRSGGFFGGLKPRDRRQIDPLFTAMGGWLCLTTAREDRAVRAGDFLLNLITSQPEMPERFYFHTNPRTGECIAKFPPGLGIAYFADRKRSKQHFFYAGAIMGFLSDIYRATGQNKYLDGARTLFDFERGMNSRGFVWPSKCKVGWGAALLYAATGETAHRKMAEKVADVTFLKAQRPDGSWDQFQAPFSDDGSRYVFVSATELTAEFTFELCELRKALAAVAPKAQ